MLPEELLFRGYAFQRLVRAIGVWPGIVVSATLFGIYHLFGSGMWGMGAFFQLAMPTMGGIVFGWAAVRTNGLALPIGLHLGGNWVQASIFSLQPVGASEPGALWTVYVTDVQQHSLYAPDFSAHAPYIVAMFVLLCVVQLALRPRAGAVQQPY
jgi:membrane protease YdiL (CAAX protease family)